MNERPTPETNKEANWTDAVGWYVTLEFAKTMERQRDDAREQAKLGWLRNSETDLFYGEALKERDEARENAKKWFRDYTKVFADYQNKAEIADLLLRSLESLLAKVECGTAINCELCDSARAAIANAKGTK